jgi:hypothetical protein
MNKFIDKKVIATQKLNAHCCKKQFFFLHACIRSMDLSSSGKKQLTELSTVTCWSCG